MVKIKMNRFNSEETIISIILYFESIYTLRDKTAWSVASFISTVFIKRLMKLHETVSYFSWKIMVDN